MGDTTITESIDVLPAIIEPVLAISFRSESDGVNTGVLRGTISRNGGPEMLVFEQTMPLGSSSCSFFVPLSGTGGTVRLTITTNTTVTGLRLDVPSRGSISAAN